jgi:hypothetical protein
VPQPSTRQYLPHPPVQVEEVGADLAELFAALMAVPWRPPGSAASSDDAASDAASADGDASLPGGGDGGGADGSSDDEYARLVRTPRGEAVQRCMGGVEPVDDVISRDLGRTFPEHPLFVAGDGQARLGRLLRAYALHDAEIGYCQGQGEAVCVEAHQAWASGLMRPVHLLSTHVLWATAEMPRCSS